MKPTQAALRAWLLLALLCLAAAAEGTREGVFVGYKETGVEGAIDAANDGGSENAAVDDLTTGGNDSDGDGGLDVTGKAGGIAGGGGAAADQTADSVTMSGGDGAGPGGQGGDGDGGLDVTGKAGGSEAGGSAAADQAVDSTTMSGGDGTGPGGHGGGADAVANLAAAAAVTGRTVVLHTQFGPIKVKLLEQLAPRTTALVWGLAEKRGCRNCAFYRNEARPQAGNGPPYALLQGRLDMPEVPPREGNIEVKMGHVCFIPETKDFFIAYGDHLEWGTRHTVWGMVDEWFATDFITAQQYKEMTHPEFGTVMRMLKEEVPLKIAVESDAFYSGLLGPMHDEPLL